MLQQLTDMYVQILEASKANPILATVISVWGLGIVTVAFRKVPASIFNFVWHQLTTSLTLNNSGYWGNTELFLSFLKWYGHTRHIRLSRTFSVDAKQYNCNSVVVGPGYGLHFMSYGGSLFWFNKSALPSSGSETQKEQITIFMLGRNQNKLRSLIEAFRPIEDTSKTYVFKARGHEWHKVSELIKRPLDSVMLPIEVRSLLLTDLAEYYSMRDWYISKGLAHKFTCMLHGVPGCGKTSLIKALAGHFNASLYILNASDISDTGLENALLAVAPGSFVILEDIDSASAVQTRTLKPVYSGFNNKSADVSPSLSGSPAPDANSQLYSMLSLTGVLNALDGAIPLNNVVVFMTTNHIDRIDDALLRKGRTDCVIELKYLEDAEIKEFAMRAYKCEAGYASSLLEMNTYNAMPGCDLQALVLANKRDFVGFMSDLNKHSVKHSDALTHLSIVSMQ